MMQTPKLLLVTTGFEKESEARACLMYLLDNKLAACGHLYKEHSAYYWNDALHQGDEWILTVKTLESLWEIVQDAIKATHPYDLPMIIGTPVTHCLPEYVDWVHGICVESTNG